MCALWIFGGVMLATGGAWAGDWPDLSSPADSGGGGQRDAALIVGIEDYVFAPDVEGALENAGDWYVHLTRARGVPVGNVFLLRDQEGTRENILDKAAAAARRVGKGGTLWVVYIGHGAPGRDGKDGILVGSDAQQSASSLYARSVPQQELFDALKDGKQARTVAIIDACFSGKSNNGRALVEGLQPLLPVRAQVGEVTVLTAAEGDQFAGPLPGARRPAFSYLALGALRGWADRNKDGDVTPAEVVSYSQDALRVLLRDRSQTPSLSGPGQNAPLSSKTTEVGPDLRALVLAMEEEDEPKDVVDDEPWQKFSPIFGYFRLGLGLGTLGPEGLAITTSDTEVNSDAFFDDYDLTLRDVQKGIDPLGVNIQTTIGHEGLVLGWLLNIAWASGLSIPATVSTIEDSFTDDVPELVRGLEATVTGYQAFQGSLTLGYRLGFERLSVYGQAGAGLGLTFVDFEFTIDGNKNTISDFEFNFVLPLTVGVDFDLYKNIFAHASYTLQVSPSASNAVHAGLGIYY